MKKTLILMLALLVVVSASVLAAYPTVTINPPQTAATITGTYAMILTFGDVADAVDNTTLHNCTWYIYSSSTANSSSTVVAAQNQSINITVPTPLVNVSIDTTTFEDASDYSVKATCTALNGTRTSTDTNTGITIDNTIPAAASSLLPADASTDTDGSVTFQGTVVDANTTACTLYFTGTNPGSRSYSMTYATTSCTKTFTKGSFPNGNYDWYIIATDGTNSTNSVTYSVRGDLAKSTAGARAFATGTFQQGSEPGTITTGEPESRDNTAIVVVLVLVGGYLMFGKKLFK